MGITWLQGIVGDVGKMAGVHLWDKWNLQPPHLKTLGGNLLLRFYCHMKWLEPPQWRKAMQFCFNYFSNYVISIENAQTKCFHNFSTCKLLRQQKVEATSQPSWWLKQRLRYGLWPHESVLLTQSSTSSHCYRSLLLHYLVGSGNRRTENLLLALMKIKFIWEVAERSLNLHFSMSTKWNW